MSFGSKQQPPVMQSLGPSVCQDREIIKTHLKYAPQMLAREEPLLSDQHHSTIKQTAELIKNKI